MKNTSRLLVALGLALCVSYSPSFAAPKKAKPLSKAAKAAAAKAKDDKKKQAAQEAETRTIASELAKIEEMRSRVLIPEITTAKDDSQMMKQLQELMLRNNPASNPWRPPGNAAGIPTGYGGGFTDLFFGAVVSSPQAVGGKYDGSVFLGGGLGDPKKYFGVDVAVGIYSIIPFARSGGVSGRIHRQFGKNYAVAIGADNIYGWENGSGMAKYVVGTTYFVLDPDERNFASTLFVHAGVGDGRFSSTSALLDGRTNYNVFGGVGLRLLRPLGLVASWTGNDLVAGLTLTPFRRIPVFLSVNFSDFATRSFAERPRFALGYSWADSWNSDTFLFKAFDDL